MGGQVRIGTSGWSYDHWAGSFYPEGLPPRDRLTYYADRFRTVEIDSTFYRRPSEESIARWRDTVPTDFMFSVKASRYITHLKKLRDPAQTLPSFVERVELLGERLGPVLFQLPPRWRSNPDRLGVFLGALDPRHRYAFEFRDPTWFEAPVLRLLERHGAAFCVYDLGGRQAPRTVTADFAYVRLHGPSAAYRGSYDSTALAGWAEVLRAWSAEGLDAYCYFDNDDRAHAPQDASRLRSLLGAH